MDWQTMLFEFLGGLGLFLFAIKFMGDGLQKIAGDRLREILDRFTTNPIIGVLVGIIVTVLIQSSSGTTVITVGLVSAGFLNLRQAIGVIMGANIGTTVTAFIIGFDFGTYSYLTLALGAFILFFFKRSTIQNIGQFLFGFAGLFVGLDMMGHGIQPLGNSDAFIELTIIFSELPILGVIVGTLTTMVFQSSSATVGILQELYDEGLISLSGALPMLFGDNIGTTITAVVASIGTSVVARRTAASHVVFNVIGTIIFLFIFPIFINYIEWITVAMNLDGKMQIAFAHGTFNLVNTIIQLPLIGLLVLVVSKLIPGEEKVIEYGPKHLDKAIIEQSPSIALGQAKQEVVRMGEYAVTGLQESMNYLITSDTRHIGVTKQLEEAIDILNKVTTEYLVELSKEPLSENNSKQHYSLLKNIRDIERIGDHFENLIGLLQSREQNRVKFSEEAMFELREIYDLVLDATSVAVMALDKNSKDFAKDVLNKEIRIDELERILHKRHIDRLNNGECSGPAGIIFADIISNLERIGVHAVNIAETILDDNRYNF